MNERNNAILRAVRLLAAGFCLAFAAASCASAPKEAVPIAAPTDDELDARGVAAWTGQGPDAALVHWEAIADAGRRETRLARIKAWKDLEEAVAAAEGSSAKGIEKAFARVEKAYAAGNGEPPLPAGIAPRVAALAGTAARALLDAGKFEAAQESARRSATAYGSTAELDAVHAEAGVLLRSRKEESAADALLAAARAEGDFHAGVAATEKAIAAYAAAGKALAADASRSLGGEETKQVEAAAARIKRKRQDAALANEKALRERAYSFKDRIGEEFARVPEGEGIAASDMEGLLAFQKTVRANVEAQFVELEDFAVRYPAVVDKDMMRQAKEQAAALDERMKQVEKEIRTAKDIASRGKPALPLLIGLFNPQRGTEDSKSRPAVMRGTGKGGADYWWGMVSVPAGEMNDLVVTASDGRTLRVFAENTKSGALAGKGGNVDLVNRSYRVGNSWPVLNAGKLLKDGKYFVQAEAGKEPAAYQAEAVVYRSFIVRMR